MILNLSEYRDRHMQFACLRWTGGRFVLTADREEYRAPLGNVLQWIDHRHVCEEMPWKMSKDPVTFRFQRALLCAFLSVYISGFSPSVAISTKPLQHHIGYAVCFDPRVTEELLCAFADFMMYPDADLISPDYKRRRLAE